MNFEVLCHGERPPYALGPRAMIGPADRRASPASGPLDRQAIAGVIGNVLEWYDFAVFGYFAPIIGRQFFPSDDHVASLLNAFGVFAAGYMMRPLGGIIFGSIGDRLGRKRALQLSIAMMALFTTLLGLLPTHAQIGVGAPVLLVLLRLIQGVSVGGELIGSVSFVTESAPPHRRGLLGSFSFASSTGGILLGSAVATLLGEIMEPATLHAWGWRIAFLVGFLVGGVGLWMRRSLRETADVARGRRGYNVTLALFGGTAPLICTWLASRTGDLAAPAYYLIAMALVSLAAALSWAPARTAG